MSVFHLNYSASVSTFTNKYNTTPLFAATRLSYQFPPNSLSLTSASFGNAGFVCHGSLYPGGPPPPYHEFESESESEPEHFSPNLSLPSQIFSLDSWKGWFLGVLLSFILPFFGSRLGPLMKLKSEVETVVETADIAAEITEIVAEKVEEVAENAANRMPDGARFNGVATTIEMAARKTQKDAQLAQHFIHKVKEVEEEVDSLVGDEDDDPIDSAMERAEQIAEVVEDVAEVVEKAAGVEADRLPQGGKLRTALTVAQNVAKKTAEDAQLVEESIEKVEEVKEEVETMIEGEGKLERMIRVWRTRHNK